MPVDRSFLVSLIVRAGRFITTEAARLFFPADHDPSDRVRPYATSQPVVRGELLKRDIPKFFSNRWAPKPPTERTKQRTFRISGFSKPAISGRGVRHLLYSKLPHGQNLRFVLDPHNPVSRTAVLIYPLDGEWVDEDLGYVPEELSRWVYEALEAGREFDCVITRIDLEKTLTKIYVKARLRKEEQQQKARGKAVGN